MREIQYQSMQYRSDRNIVSYYSFAGGIFDTENADRVADNEVSDMINLDIVNDGSLKMRDNFILSDMQPTTVQENKSYNDVTVFDKGTAYEIIGILDNKIVKIPSEEVLVDSFGSSMNTVQYGNRLYIIGNGRFMVYDGDKIEDVATYHAGDIENLTEEEKERNDLDFVKDGKFITISQGRIIIAGITSEPNSVYMSEPWKPWFFDSKDLADVMYPSQSDNDRVTALYDYADGLMVFKRESIYIISGTLGGANTQMYRMNVPTGTMSPKTIKRVDNFLLFLGTDRKVYGLYGGSYYSMNKDRVSIYSMSGTIERLLQRIPTTKRENVTATYYKGMYILAYPHEDEDGRVTTETLNMYVLDKTTNSILSSQAWGRYDHVDIKGFIEIPGQELNMYSNTSTRLYKFSEDATSDYDIYGNNQETHLEQYTVYIKFKNFNLETPEHYKIFRAGWIQFNKAYRTDFKEFKHNIYIDNKFTYLPYIEDMQTDQFDNAPEKWSSDGAEILWDDFYWAGKENNAYYFRINAKGRTVQNELKFQTYGRKVRILGTSFEVKIKYPQRNNFNTGFKRGN